MPQRKAHRAREAVDFKECETPADLWSSNSPDLNSVDYRILGIIQQRVHETKVQDVNDLRQRLIDVLSGIKQSGGGRGR